MDREIEEIEEDESIGKRAVRTLYSLFVGKFFTALLSGITLIVVARLLEPGNYGIYTFVIGFAGVIGAANHFGIGTYLNRYIAEFNYKKDKVGIGRAIVAGYAVLLPIAVVMTLIGIGASGYVAAGASNLEVTTFMLYLASFVVMFSMLQGASYSALVGFGKANLAAISSIFVNVVQLVGSAGLVILGFGVNGAIFGILIGYLLGFLLSIYYVHVTARRKGVKYVKPSKKDMKEAFKFSVPVTAKNLVDNGIVSLSVLILGIFIAKSIIVGNSIVVGNYGVALQGYNLLTIVSGTLTTVLLPTFTTAISMKAKKGSKNKDIMKVYNNIIFYSMILVLPLTVYVGVLAKPVIFLLITEQYATAPFFMELIALGTIISTIGLLTSSLVVAAGKVNKLLKYTIISLVVQLVAMIGLVWLWGTTGVIIGVFYIGGIVNTYLYVNWAIKSYGGGLEWRRLAKMFLSNAILILPMYLVLLLNTRDFIEVGLGLVVLVLAYPILLVAFRSITKEELNKIQNIIPNVSILQIVAKIVMRYFNFWIKAFGA